MLLVKKTSTSYALLKDQNGNNVKDLTERGNEKLNIYINFNEEIVDKYERYFFKDDYSKFQKQDKFNYYQNLKEIIGDFGTIKSKDMNDYDKKLLSEFIMAHELGHSFFSNNVRKEYDKDNIYGADAHAIILENGKFSNLREEINAETFAFLILKEKYGNDFEKVKDRLLKMDFIQTRYEHVNLKEQHVFTVLYNDIYQNKDYFKNKSLSNFQEVMNNSNEYAVRTVNLLHTKDKFECAENQRKEWCEEDKEYNSVQYKDFFNKVMLDQQDQSSQNQQQSLNFKCQNFLKLKKGICKNNSLF